MNFPILRQISHKNANYGIRAQLDPTNGRVDVEMLDGTGKPVVITYPDGFQATLVHTVNFTTRISMAQATGISAVDHLMDTAEADLRRLV